MSSAIRDSWMTRKGAIRCGVELSFSFQFISDGTAPARRANIGATELRSEITVPVVLQRLCIYIGRTASC
jgi:hypothetical protein